MKLIRNNKGFTLMEVLIAVGLTSVMLTIIMQTQSVSEKTVSDLQLHTEVNALISTITSELSKPAVCSYNLKRYNAPTNGPLTAPTPLPMPRLENLNGKLILETGPTVVDVSTIKKVTRRIDSIDSITYLGTAATQSADIVVTYTPHGKAPQSFTITLNVYPGSDPTKVETCYYDEKSALINAVKKACKGVGAHYNASGGLYGTCEHTVKVLNSSDSALTPATSLACPTGEFLTKVDAPVDGVRTFTCKKLETLDPQCGNWEYMAGIKADGKPDCKNVLEAGFFGAGSTGLMATYDTGTGNKYYRIVNLDCTAGKILIALGADFVPSCIDPKRALNCPAGQVLYGIDSSGNLQCTNYPNNNACGGGSYMTAVNSSGVVTCGNPTLSGSCTNPYVVNGTTAGGAVTCTLNPY